MPTVPVERRLISTDVPGATVPTVGTSQASDQALGQLGDKISQVSFSMLGDVKKQQAMDASSKAYYDDFIQSSDYARKLKLSSPDGYVYDNSGLPKLNPDGQKRTITDEYRDWADSRYQQNQEQMPSLMAQNLYKERSGDFFSKEIVGMRTDEVQSMINDSNATLDENTQRLSDQMTKTPVSKNAYEFSNSLSLDVQQGVGKFRNDAQAREKVQKINNQIAESTFRGGYNQVLMTAKNQGSGYSPVDEVNKWLSVMRGEDKESQQRKEAGLPSLGEMLKPDDRAKLEEAFIRLLKDQHDNELSDLPTRIKNANAASLMGKPDDGATTEIMKIMNRAVDNGDMTPIQRADRLADLQGHFVLGKVTNTPGFYLMPESAQLKTAEQGRGMVYSAGQTTIMQDASGKDIGRAAELSFSQAAQGEIAQSTAQKKDDFAAYVSSHDVGLAAKVANLDFSNPVSLQDKSGQIQDFQRGKDQYYARNFPGHPEFNRPIDKVNSQLLAKTLMDPNYGTQQTAEGIKALQKAYGSYYPEVINQLIKDGNLHEGWRFAGIMNDYLSTEDVVSALKGKTKAVEDNFKTWSAAKGIDEKDFDSLVGKAVAPFMVAMAGQRPNEQMKQEQIQTMVEVVKDRAKQRLYETNGQVSKEQAILDATQSLINNHLHLKETGGGGFLGIGENNGQKNIIAIPKRLNGQIITDDQANYVRTNLDQVLNPDALKKAGALPPPQSNGVPSQFDDKFYQQVQQTGRSSLAPNQQGYYLWYTDRQANRDVQVFTKDTKGNVVPLVIPADQMLARPAEKPAKKYNLKGINTGTPAPTFMPKGSK